jgi:NAD(P)-dependent dehydrogenase (short-subunit alcohol dehydrogenase family)
MQLIALGLEGRPVLVTVAAFGIGASFVRAIGWQGATVIVHSLGRHVAATRDEAATRTVLGGAAAEEVAATALEVLTRSAAAEHGPSVSWSMPAHRTREHPTTSRTW